MLVLLRKKFRKLIFPKAELLACVARVKTNKILDVGAGTGLFLEMLDAEGLIGQSALGVEVGEQYFGRINSKIEIVPEHQVKGPFDFIIFNDVLHHVGEKKNFLSKYIDNYLSDSGYVLIKDMNPEKPLYRYFNRLHDLIFAGERIREISKSSVREYFSENFVEISSGEKRIFLYDHYFMLFRKKENHGANQQL